MKINIIGKVVLTYSLPKVVTQLRLGGNRTHDILVASPTPYTT